MNSVSRWAGPALLACALTGVGCESSPAPTETGPAFPPSAAPKETPILTAPSEAKSEPAAAPAATATDTADAAQKPKSADHGGIALQKMTYADFLARVAKNPKAKYTIVDAWASWCGPCKENFPHLVEMHHKYADKGLAVASLSLDDPKKPKDVAAAEKFLNEKQANFTNVLLDEDADAGVGFEKLNINSIPAVFVFDPSGKEVKRFTGDDPNHQYTYDEVEKYVVALLEGKTPPAGETEKTPGK